EDMARGADDEHVAQPLVEGDLGGHPRVAAAEDHRRGVLRFEQFAATVRALGGVDRGSGDETFVALAEGLPGAGGCRVRHGSGIYPRPRAPRRRGARNPPGRPPETPVTSQMRGAPAPGRHGYVPDDRVPSARAAAAAPPAAPAPDVLLDWFDRHGRDLPWRRPGTTACQGLISEVMLQQTPVVRVLPVWQEWVARWPTPD